MADASGVVSMVIALVCASPVDDVLIVGVVDQFAPRWVALGVVAVLFTLSIVDVAMRLYEWRLEDD